MTRDANFVAKNDQLMRHLDISIETATPEYAKASMPLHAHHKNGMGAAHGGSLFSLADITFGAAANSTRKNGVVNLYSSIEYLRPCLKGPITAEAHAVRVGGHILSYDVRVFDGDGVLVAKMMTSGYCTDIPLPE